jgi:hypothetical protein
MRLWRNITPTARRYSTTPGVNIRLFAETADVHDGLLRRVALDRRLSVLHLSLWSGDLQQRYFDPDIMYFGLRLDRLDAALLELIARDAHSEALYLEEDIIYCGNRTASAMKEIRTVVHVCCDLTT